MSEEVKIFLTEREMDDMKNMQMKDQMLKIRGENKQLEIKNKKLTLKLMEREMKDQLQKIQDSLKNDIEELEKITQEVNKGRTDNKIYIKDIKKKYGIKEDAEIGFMEDGEIVPPQGNIEEFLINNSEEKNAEIVQLNETPTDGGSL